MRIGSREATQQTRAYSQERVTPEDFGAGVAQALGSLGNALGEFGVSRAQLASLQRRREETRLESEALLDWQRTTGALERELLDSRVSVAPGAPNYTNNVDARFTTAYAEFERRHPQLFADPERATAFRTRMEAARQSNLTSSFAFELEQENTANVAAVRDLVSEGQVRLRTDPAALDSILEGIREYAQVAQIPPTVWQTLETEALASLASVWVEQEMVRAAQDQTPVRTPYEVAATQEGAVDTSQPLVLGRSGTPDAPVILVRTPGEEGTARIARGETLPSGWTFVGAEGDELILRSGDLERRVGVGDALPAPTGEFLAQPVAPAISGIHRGLLTGIASVESNGANPYNMLYGGAYFEGYEDHPRITRRTPEGTPTTAAGRYQFLAGTWDYVRERMEAEGYDFGPQPFSPANQDRAALWYANYRYGLWARQRGLPAEQQDMNAMLASGNQDSIELVRQALAGQGRNTVWEGLQRMTSGQFFTFITGGIRQGGTGTAQRPDVWTDPRFASIPYTQRLEIERGGATAAANALAAARAETQARQQSLLDSLTTMAQDHDPRLFDAVEAALPQFRDVQMRGQALALVEEERELRTNAQTAMDAVTSARPLSAAQVGAVDAMFEVQGITRGIAARDPQAAAAAVTAFASVGTVGPEFIGTLMGMTTHANPENQIYALETLASMHRVSPLAFAALRDEEARNAGRIWAQLDRQSGSAQEALQRYNLLRSPEGARIREARQTQARELLADFAPDQMLRSVTGVLERTFGSVSLPRGFESALFQEHYQDAFEFAFVQLGDEAAAHGFASETLQGMYHPSPLTGELQYLSPTSPVVSSVVGMQGRDPSWISEALRAAHPELASASAVRLVTDNQTLAQVGAGQPPTYMIQTVDANGVYFNHLDENNQPVRFTLRPNARQLLDIEAENQDAYYQSRIQGAESQLRRIDSALQLLDDEQQPGDPYQTLVPRTPPAAGERSRLLEERLRVEQEMTRAARARSTLVSQMPQRELTQAELISELEQLYLMPPTPQTQARIEELNLLLRSPE